MENQNYSDKPFFIVDTIIVMGTVIDTSDTRHVDESEARKAFTTSVDSIIENKFLVRLLRVSATGEFDEIARYHSPS